jgi:hypothetical protein
MGLCSDCSRWGGWLLIDYDFGGSKMSVSQNYPNIAPSLSLDFASVKKLDPRISFSRPTVGGYYDGKTVSLAEQNLLPYSQEFDNAAWLKGNASVTANTTAAPDGSTTADSLNEGTATAAHLTEVVQTPVPNANYAYSCFAKDIDGVYLVLAIRGAVSNYASATFNLSTGTVDSSGAAGTGFAVSSTSIVDVGDGWYRCVLNLVVGTTLNSPRNFVSMWDGVASIGTSGLYSYTGTSRSIAIWGAQIEQRSSVTAYTPTTTQPITNYIPTLLSAPANVARFDHNPTTGESLGLLVEEQRTNLATYSEDFASGDDEGVTFAAAVNPSGTINNCKVIVNSGQTFPTLGTRVKRLTSAVGNTDTASVFAKAGEYDSIRLEAVADNNSGRFVRGVFNLSNGTVTTSQGGDATWFSGLSATIKEVGNGWYRCSITFKVEPSTNFARPYWQPADSVATTGDGYSGVFMFGAQLEAGAFPTSYIKTEASQVTRSADLASMTGTNFSSWYRADEGTLYAEGRSALISTSSAIAGISNNSNFNRTLEISIAPRLINVNSNVNDVSLSGSALTANVFAKLAASAQLNNFAFSVNGATPLTDTSGIVPSNVNGLAIGRNLYGTALNALNGTIKKIAYYPARLTNAQLQALTS